MRIAIVIDYSLDLIGGAQRAALNEAAALVAAGHAVLLVGPRPASAELLPVGVEPCWTAGRRLPALDFPLVADDAGLRGLLLRRFRAARIDAVHLHSEFGHAGAARAAARALGLPVVQTIHTAYWPGVPSALVPAARGLLAHLAGPVPRRSGHPLLDHTLASAMAADVVVSPSAHQAADLARLGVGAVVQPNCGDPREERLRPLPAVDHLRVAWIGRCVPEKRLIPFVHSVGIAQRRLPAGALRVAIAGDGLLLPAARTLGRRVPGLTFLGRIDRAGVQRLIGASHLTALTSHGFDNQPMTVVESIRAGRGVLHTDPRLTEGLDLAGLLAPGPRATAIADLLVELALDPSRVVAAAAGAREAAVRFAPGTHLARLLPLLAATPAAIAA